VPCNTLLSEYLANLEVSIMKANQISTLVLCLLSPSSAPIGPRKGITRVQRAVVLEAPAAIAKSIAPDESWDISASVLTWPDDV
jgi:hypothetical protein